MVKDGKIPILGDLVKPLSHGCRFHLETSDMYKHPRRNNSLLSSNIQEEFLCDQLRST